MLLGVQQRGLLCGAARRCGTIANGSGCHIQGFRAGCTLTPRSGAQRRIQLRRLAALPSFESLSQAGLTPAQNIVGADVTAAGATSSQLWQHLCDVSDGLETPVQLIYLLALLGFLGVGAYLVVRQLLLRQQLDEAAKGLGERVRKAEANFEDYFELGVILTRKKLFTQASKNLEKAKKVWKGEDSELAKVHNALGFCYFSMEKADLAIAEYRRAVELQPGYVTAWNNLGDAYESTKSWREAFGAYKEVLNYAPTNKIAQQRVKFCQNRLEGLGL